MTREIPLTRGLVALVDDDDFERVSQFRWYPAKSATPNGTTYAQGRAGTRVTISMHRFILQPPPGFEIDHANHDGLDNRRSNLRLCTRSQNIANRRPAVTGRTGYRGVTPATGGNGFRVRVEFEGERRHIGHFFCPVEAAHAYDEAARRIHGAFAILNFPEAA